MPNRIAKNTAGSQANPNRNTTYQQRSSVLPDNTMSNIVMAEMLLLQAVVESAAVIGEGLDELGAHLTSKRPVQRSVSGVLIRTANAALEPYATRLNFLQELQDIQETQELR
ncbi:MAG: hypothetical protein ABJ056_17650 [Halioglobus sp.]